jgi:hypothetical protein
VTLNDLLPDTLGRIEENVESGAPIFWNLNGEVLVQMVDAMFEAALVTATVQTSAVSITLPANKTFFNLQASASGFDSDAALQTGVLAPIRLRQAWPIRKTTLKALDDMQPNWQQATPSTQLIAWGPLGVSGFFIYPAFSVDTQVNMDFITSPVNQYRPYSGSIGIPFQTEFADAFSQGAASMLRMKESGAEAEEASAVQQQYLSRLKALSLFQSRIDSLDMTLAFGGRGQVNPRSQV